MRVVIVSGISGAGKSTALDALEDAGYFCIDNLPISLIGKFVELACNGDSADINRIAIGADVRNIDSFDKIREELDSIKELGVDCELLFLDADDEVLVKRFKETRRPHPLGASGRLEDNIALERSRTAFIMERADHVIDTSHLRARELKKKINDIFVDNRDFDNLFITILSFGFKYGIPIDSDLVFDVRFLPNPFYLDDLRMLTGKDEAVIEYLKGFSETGEFADKLEDMVRFLIPGFIREEKHQLIISVGCTGGRHRSVMIAEELYKRLSGSGSYDVRIEHRDLDNDLK